MRLHCVPAARGRRARGPGSVAREDTRHNSNLPLTGAHGVTSPQPHLVVCHNTARNCIAAGVFGGADSRLCRDAKASTWANAQPVRLSCRRGSCWRCGRCRRAAPGSPTRSRSCRATGAAGIEPPQVVVLYTSWRRDSAGQGSRARPNVSSVLGFAGQQLSRFKIFVLNALCQSSSRFTS